MLLLNAGNLGNGLHEIARINIAQALYDRGYQTELEFPLGGGKEADLVADGKYVWEVKPINRSGESRLTDYEALGGLERGNKLADAIPDIPIVGDIKMRIDFGEPGKAYYSFYRQDRRGNQVGVKYQDVVDEIQSELDWRQLLWVPWQWVLC